MCSGGPTAGDITPVRRIRTKAGIRQAAYPQVTAVLLDSRPPPGARLAPGNPDRDGLPPATSAITSFYPLTCENTLRRPAGHRQTLTVPYATPILARRLPLGRPLRCSA